MMPNMKLVRISILSVFLLLDVLLVEPGHADVTGWSQGVSDQCRNKCNSTLISQINNNFNIRCNDSCKIDKCSEGCDLWTEALYIPCQDLCNGTLHHVAEKSLYCMMGCHSAVNVYVKNVEGIVGTPAAPSLVPGTQTNVSVTLRWESSSVPNITYLVQWKYKALPGDWEYYQPTTALHKTECLVIGLRPYTEYKFRIAWIILKQHSPPLISEESHVISTLAYGVPAGAPVISLSVIDSSRIQVSWDPPLFCNGPVLSYAVSLKNLANGHSLVKDISNQNAERFYIFNGLKPNTSYRVSVLARNSMGEGPSETKHFRTPASVLKNDDNPYLVLGAKHLVIKIGINLLEEAHVIYQSENASDFIRGVALHVKDKVAFLSDSMGYVYSVSLEGTTTLKMLLKPSTHNKQPSILSVDWLYNKLYLVDGKGIARCNLDGTGYENVVVSLPSRPTEMKVDPYNGFLFWILGNHNKSHLYKVDLLDLESDPLTLDDTKLIFSEDHLMAFAADHSSLQLLLPSETKNTVVAVSLDGLEVTDIRQNTQQAKFNNVKSVVVHHGLLFWTTGQEVLGEEHQSDVDIYYHNSYYMLTSQKPFVGLNVLHPDAQPYPVPLNPVRYLEVVFDVNQCRISWRPPKLLRGIGLGSWQKWNYELRISDDANQETLLVLNITSTSYTAQNLSGNLTYYVKVRPYSDGGKGPWSEEFKGRSLREGNQNNYPFMLWSSREGILKSNMLATIVEPFLNAKLLHNNHVDDFAWYEDLLFLNTNSNHILVYNTTLRHPPKRIHSISSAHSLAVDCFAKKLYWSNPYPQVISRSNFDGSQQEPLPIPTVAKELNVDSASGFLYWTTMYSVECARLNGVQRQVYFQAGFFAGKQVLGLTVDRDHYQVFWMVRSQEGAQLFKGTMAGYTDLNLKDTVQEVAVLQEDIIRGPLRYYSDRLFWLHDQREALITDINGRNVATLNGPGLSNLKTLTIVEPHFHQYPEGLTKEILNVRPDQVPESSLKISGTWDNFNISWQASTNTNYGNIFYEVKIDSEYDKSTMVTEDNYFAYVRDQPLPPYTNITIDIRAFTYWSSSRSIIRVIASPMSVPSEPVNPRIFISHEKPTLMSSQTNIVGRVRWSPPEQANGIIKGYFVACWEKHASVMNTKCNITLISPKLEYVLRNLLPNSTYYFQVTAFTEIGMGPGSNVVKATTADESPVPRLLLTKWDAVEVTDMDTHEEELIAMDATEPLDVTYLSQDKLVFWIDRKQNLMQSKMDGSNRTRLLSLSSSGCSITVDWVGRYLYWAESDEAAVKSVIWKMDLNYDSKPKKLVERDGIIQTLRVNPFESTLLWTLKDESDVGLLMMSTADGKNIEHLFNRAKRVSNRRRRSKNKNNNAGCTCPKEVNVGKPLTIDTSSSDEQQVLWVDQTSGHIWAADINGCNCHVVVNSSFVTNNGLPPTSITVDKTRVYWSNASLQSIFSIDKDLLPSEKDKEKQNLVLMEVVNGVNIISAIGNSIQPMPDMECLIPLKYENPPKLFFASSSFITLQMASLYFLPDCNAVSRPSSYYIIFYQLVEEDNMLDCSLNESKCFQLKSYEELTNVSSLLPFRQYAFQVAVGNFYTEKHSALTRPVIFMTDEGAPSRPFNVTVDVVSPDKVLVSWSPSKELNSPFIHYYLNWEMKSSAAGHQRQGEQIVYEDQQHSRMFAVLEKLLPERSYFITVRAYASKMTAFNESAQVAITTFSLPGNLSEEEVTSSSLTLQWHLMDEVNILNATLLCREVYPNQWIDSIERTMYNSSIYYYTLQDLHPKTKHICHFIVSYCAYSHHCNYTWPKDDAFTFETLGDCPSVPGIPLVTHLKKDSYQITWNPSVANGGKYVYYILQAKSHYASEDDDSEWQTMYNGTQGKWLVSGLDFNYEYVFRVKALNEYGRSNYSHISLPFDFSETGFSEDEPSIILAVGVAVIIVLILIIICVLFKVCKEREKDKLMLQDAIHASGNPDLELATLQELPRNGNFVHQANILYSVGNGLDEELAALPHISRDQIILTKFLGSGAFGEVFEGFARDLQENIDGNLKVAIKTLRKGATDQEKGEFLKEAQLMSNFKHEHILRLLGVCLDNDPNFIILELMEGGDLLSYLRSNRSTVMEPSLLTVQDLISICVDVARGCKYLEEMHFVHRDLAARNCLVSSRNPTLRVVKIGDFGLARDIYKNDYYRKEGEGLLPVRWMSPESLMDGVFTTQSDVWAFGVLLWEVMTLGQQPYPARTNLEVLHHVRAGGRLDKPDNCPDDLHELMLLCWNYNPDHRPSFLYCLEQLQELKRKSADLPTCIHNNHYIGRTGDGICNDGFNEDELTDNAGSEPSSLMNDREAFLSTPDIANDSQSPHNSLTSAAQNNRSFHSNKDIPKYLELLCDDPNLLMLPDDGYEVPISSTHGDKETLPPSRSSNPVNEGENEQVTLRNGLTKDAALDDGNNLKPNGKLNSLRPRPCSCPPQPDEEKLSFDLFVGSGAEPHCKKSLCDHCSFKSALLLTGQNEVPVCHNLPQTSWC